MKRPFTLLAALVAVALTSIAMIEQPPEGRSQTMTPIKEMVGVDAVVNDSPADLAQTVGWVRDYHKWYWYETTNDVYTWDGPWQYLDTFYNALNAAGVKVMPDVEFAPDWASSNGQRDGVPDAVEHAQYLGDLVRHYGNGIAAVENYNEPNQTWQPVPFPANQFGAMTAQDYASVKAANPNMTFVLAGMAGPDTTYLDAANQASGGKFDVVNFHWYAPGDTTNGGKNPESGGLFSAIDQVKAWRDAKASGKPIWISEFGWDTYMASNGAKSKIYAPEADAGNYLLRAIFLMEGRGVEKAFAYIYRDPTSNAAYLGGTYNSAGLVTNNAEVDGRKKVGWYYLATLKNVLGDYSLDQIVSNGPNLYHYEYAIPGTDKRAAVLWARNGERDDGYQVSYQSPPGTLVVPTDGSTTGTVSTTDGSLTLTERPVFVLYTSGSSPGVPALDSPTDGSAIATLRPTLRWQASGGALSYVAEIADDPYLQIPTQSVWTSDLSYTSEVDLDLNTLYYWRVRAFGSGGVSPPSEAWRFWTSPTLTSPTNGSSISNLTPTLDWADYKTGSDTATRSYGVQVTEDASFTSDIVVDDSTTYSVFTVPAGLLSLGKTYYWRVNVSSSEGTSGWSAIFRFTTPPPPLPPAPLLLSPADESTIDSLSPVFHWQGSSYATGYRIQVSPASNFNSFVANAMVTNSTYSLPSWVSLSHNKVYYWRSQGYNKAGFGSWSPTNSFTTPQPQLPSTPTLGSPGLPVGGTVATIDTLNPSFRWSVASNATSYHLIVATNSWFGTKVVDTAVKGASSFTFSGDVAPLSTLYWRVNAKNAAGTSGWSAAWSFKTP